MFHVIKIIIVSAIAHYSAYWVLSRLTPFGEELKKYFISSVVVIAVSLIVRNILIGYMVMAFLCVHFNRTSDASQKIAYFFGMAFSMSIFAGYFLSPGIFLGGLSHPRLMTCALILPMMFTMRPDPKIYRFHGLDKAVMLFFVMSFLLNFRGDSITGTMRGNLWLFLDFILPYIIIRRYLQNYALVLAALSFALMSQAAVGAAEAILKWHIHTDIEILTGFADPVMAQYKFRGPFLRAQASFMNPLIFALFANMSFLCSLIYVTKIGITPPATYKPWIAWAGLGISTLGTLSTGSRAGIAGAFIIVFISVVLLWALKRKRDPKKKIVTWALIGLLGIIFFGGDFLRENFEYRMRLLDIGSEVVMSHPWTGNLKATEDPRMQTLHLGEGIIDIVNTYLDFALHKGIPVMLVFMYIILSGLGKLYDSLRSASDEKLSFGIFAFASLFVLAFNLATTSAFGWTYPWIWLSIAIGANIVARVQAEKREAYLKERGDLF